jgi:hypothetical protein
MSGTVIIAISHGTIQEIRMNKRHLIELMGMSFQTTKRTQAGEENASLFMIQHCLASTPASSHEHLTFPYTELVAAML